jgi:DnaJ-class molecular chaperone
MATIIDLGDGGFIAGDTDTVLAPENHWCEWCGGYGLEHDPDWGLTVCDGCGGSGQSICEDEACEAHRTA